MPSTITVNEVINKLTTQPNKRSTLVLNSLEAIKKYKELLNKITTPNVSDNSLRVLGAFLQHTSLDLFTQEELLTLAQFDYSKIENTKIVLDIDNQQLNKPYYDLDDKLINLSLEDNINLKNNFQRLLSINKQLSLEYLISYIINQL